MAIPFRTRRALRSIGIILLITLLAAALILGFWFLWLGRFQVFSRDGSVRLDFSHSSRDIVGVPAVPPEAQETVSIYFNEGDNAISTSKELTQITGYYVTAQDLYDDAAGVLAQIKTLPAGTTLMIDVKNGRGDFFYSSGVSTHRSSSIDPVVMDELIAYLDSAQLYTIARFPAMVDYHHGLNNVPHGLHHSSGLYLWSDSDGYYWLDPTSQGTVAYWVQIITELRDLGFDEVLLSNYYFPDTSNILFSGDKAQALTDTAQTLVTTCARETFAVSFVREAEFTHPDGRSRQYRVGVAAADAATVAAESGFADPTINLVFLTDVHDTRFDTYSVLRPLSSQI